MENSLFLNEGSNNIGPLKLFKTLKLFPVVSIAIAKWVETLLSRKIHSDVGQANAKRDQLFIDPLLCCGVHLNYGYLLT